jgi:hypothetical protein
MARTSQLDLPLVMPAQAQKHVTVNESLARLDAAAQLRVLSSLLLSPPSIGVDGQSYLVPAGATGAWDGRVGQIAVWSNGGWTYLLPKAGWRAWDESRTGYLVFDGMGWTPDAITVSPNGACARWSVIEFDHVVSPGSTNATSVSIPGNTQVLGVTGRVASALTGPGLTTWRIGVAGSDSRYGSGLGIGLNSYLIGLSGTPVTYYEATPLLFSAEGGSLSSGTVRLALHVVQLEPPRPV